MLRPIASASAREFERDATTASNPYRPTHRDTYAVDGSVTNGSNEVHIYYSYDDTIASGFVDGGLAVCAKPLPDDRRAGIIGKPKRDKARTHMQKASRRRNRK